MPRLLAFLCCIWYCQSVELRGSSPEGPRQLSKAEASQLLDEAVAVFQRPENKQRLLDAASVANKEQDPTQKMMLMMSNVMPLAQSMMHDPMTKYGFSDDDALAVLSQVQALAKGDATMSAKLELLQGALQGSVH
eukprot:TRINITY_DN7087_c0_g1_i3.p1 TRINITY_DN7087_c0_g1~~TRINITY_DN7087_c0_g1_i3.p1  ORF type:complete len:135 (+),score=33.56 TRINITY_DN7087_c0_g1_i3:67-471(+)